MKGLNSGGTFLQNQSDIHADILAGGAGSFVVGGSDGRPKNKAKQNSGFSLFLKQGCNKMFLCRIVLEFLLPGKDPFIDC